MNMHPFSLTAVAGLILSAVTVPAAAQNIAFDETLSLSCYYESGVTDGDGYPADVCFGVSANACMEATSDGGTTVGMGFCLRAEYELWDGLLNEAYGNLMLHLKARDTEFESAAPSQAEALRDMQRAWIPYRDARCNYVRSRWGGGSGAGVAQTSCLMAETARQYHFLTEQMEQY